MRTAKVQITISLFILSVAAFLFWVQLRPPPPPPKTPFQIGQEAFAKQMEADTVWYRQADAHGVSYKKYIPMEIAASNATIHEYDRVAKSRPDWGSLSVEERTRITDEINQKADGARQAMRASYYTEPFKPGW